MRPARPVGIACALLLLAARAHAGNPANPILFVTQVPMPEEVNSRTITESYQSCVSPFSNHLPDTAHAGRGGSLHVRFSNGTVIDLLAIADWSAIPGGKPAANTVAVRNPAVNWTADKALFSMVVGAPAGPMDQTQFLWQLHEITLPTQTQLANNVKPVLSKVANQPAYNNVFPAYALGGRIVFASDRPWNGQPHLLQREEYLGLPTVAGLYSLDPSAANSLQLLHHAPSGAFTPFVDSAGRLIFTSWDHLARDAEAVTDSRNGVMAQPYAETFTQTFNGSGNFLDETAGAGFTPVTQMAPNSWDLFPEPRNFDKKSLIDDFGNNLNGNAQNVFLPWMINLDGTGGEIVNHVGRQELVQLTQKNFKNDANLVDLFATANPGYGGLTIHTFVNGMMWTREDPLSPGTFYGSDAVDLGTHGAGQIVRLNNAGVKNGQTQNPDGITVTYITGGANNNPKPGFVPIVKPSINLPATGQTALTMANAETLYRTPVPLADGNLIASHVGNVTQTDYNVGTIAQPQTLYAFRLRSLKLSGQTYIPDVTLTAGININTTYWVGATQVSYNGPAWELDPVEVTPRNAPVAATASVDPVEAGVFATAGVHIPTFQKYLRGVGGALVVSRDVTRRDLHDRQQPFNLKITWSNTQATGAGGTIYSVAWIQLLQADLRRGYLLGGNTPAVGRRVVATPLHDTWAENLQDQNAPPGSLRLFDDGSFAAVVPAEKAMTWHLLGNDANKTSYVKERFWVTFQKGEIRTCANCHGINTSDQTGSIQNPVPKPTNPPLALAALLAKWKLAHPAGSVAFSSASAAILKNAGAIQLTVQRTGGSTGPAAVDYATADGTAKAGADYTAQNGKLNWADGDLAPRTLNIAIANNPAPGNRAFTVTLSKPQYAALGGVPVETVTINDLPAVDMAMTPMDMAMSPVDMAMNSPDIAMDAPDLAMSIPDMAMSTPDLAMSAADLAMNAPDLAMPAVIPDLASAPASDGAMQLPGGNMGSGCSVGRGRAAGHEWLLAGTLLLAGLIRRRRNP